MTYVPINYWFDITFHLNEDLYQYGCGWCVCIVVHKSCAVSWFMHVGDCVLCCRNSWLPADDKCISKNNDQLQCKAITEQPDSRISAVDLTAPRPNKLLLPSWNLTVARKKICHPNTSGPLESDVIKNCSPFTAQTTATDRSSCGNTAADLNKFAAITAARPTDLAVTFDRSPDCDDPSHSAMARKSRSLEDIPSRPSPNKTKNSRERGILSTCKKHSSYWIKVLASPVAYGLDKHLLHCQVTKSDSFQSPSSGENPEMIFVSWLMLGGPICNITNFIVVLFHLLILVNGAVNETEIVRLWVSCVSEYISLALKTLPWGIFHLCSTFA